MLATEATALVHGRDAAEEAADTARRPSRKARSAKTLPTVEVPSVRNLTRPRRAAAFVKAGLVASNGEARRQIKGGGMKVNDAAVTDDKMCWREDLTPEGVIKLSLGQEAARADKPIQFSAAPRKPRSDGIRNSKNLRNRPGATTENGLTLSRGAFGGPTTSKVRPTRPSFSAAQEKAEHRDLTEHVVEPKNGTKVPRMRTSSPT